MATPIRIGPMRGRDALDLARALAVRGLIGQPVRTGRSYTVEVADSHEESDRLVAEVTGALAQWLADGGRRSVTLHVAGSHRTVRAA